MRLSVWRGYAKDLSMANKPPHESASFTKRLEEGLDRFVEYSFENEPVPLSG